jgi:hypothetical protein
MGFGDEVERSLGRPCRHERQVQADMRTHLIHRSARDIIPPLGGARSFLLLGLILGGLHAASLFPSPAELSAINPDAVHDHGQPAGKPTLLSEIQHEFNRPAWNLN